MKSFAPRPAAAPAAPAAAATPALALADHRPAAVAQRQLLAHIAASPRQATPLQPAGQRAAAPRPTRPNATGLPDQLKAGIEQLSGHSLDDVRVHYNSARPAQLQALAYAQGSDIHLGPGQEKHLPHEAWHVVQQQQGRVRATRQLKGVGVNDDAGLEREADDMGRRATAMGHHALPAAPSKRPLPAAAHVMQRVLNRQGVEVDEKELNNGELTDLLTFYNGMPAEKQQVEAELTRRKETPTATIGQHLGLEQLHEERNRTGRGYRKTAIDQAIADRKNGSPRGALEDWAWQAYAKRQELMQTIAGQLQGGQTAAAVKTIKGQLYAYYSAYPQGTVLENYGAFMMALGEVEQQSVTGEGKQRFVVYPQNSTLTRPKTSGPGVRERTVAKEHAMQQCLEVYGRYKESLDNMFAYRVTTTEEVNLQKANRSTRSRITLRLDPSRATEVFRVVATEIVGDTSNNAHFRYVKQAKIMGPAKIGTSSDSMIIYVGSTNPRVINGIVAHLQSKFDETYFKEGGPMTMNPIAKGVSYADRATAVGGVEQSSSHGTSRSLPIAEAFVEMAQTVASENFASFFNRVARKLTARKINPEKPYENLP